MAGNRKINNQEQLASVRAKLNDNFEELSDAVTQLQPLTAVTDAGSDGFIRANADGTFDTIKTAPPDGGLGDNSAIQATSNFDGKLPDQLVIKHIQYSDTSVDTHGGYVICELRQVSVNKIIYADTWGDGAHRISFNNNSTGDGWNPEGATGGAHFLSPIDGVSAPTIQQLVDNGFGIFHGQKSGTSGAGSLSVIKTDLNINLYTELPDAIVAHTVAGYNAILRLKYVRTSANTTNNDDDFFYEARYDPSTTGTGDFVVTFKNDTDGTFNRSVGTNQIDTNFHKSLRWFIENGRAMYYGGQQDFGVKAWGKFDGTGTGDLSYTGGNVASITKTSTGNYKVTFINAMPHADYAVSGSVNPSGYNGAKFGHRENGDTYITTAQSFHIDCRTTTTNTHVDSNCISFQIVC